MKNNVIELIKSNFTKTKEVCDQYLACQKPRIRDRNERRIEQPLSDQYMTNNKQAYIIPILDYRITFYSW